MSTPERNKWTAVVWRMMWVVTRLEDNLGNVWQLQGFRIVWLAVFCGLRKLVHRISVRRREKLIYWPLLATRTTPNLASFSRKLNWWRRVELQVGNGKVCRFACSGSRIIQERGNLIVRLAREWGGRILDFSPTKRRDARKKAVDQAKMSQKAEKRKHFTLGRKLTFFWGWIYVVGSTGSEWYFEWI